VVLLLIDATQGVSDQDAHIAGYILDSGRAVVVAINKWDATDDYQRETLQRSIESRLAFLKFAPVLHISASAPGAERGVEGDPAGPRLGHHQDAHAGADAAAARGRRAPGAARAGRFRPKLRYAHQGGMNPPLVVIHGNSLEHVTDSLQALPGRALSASTSSSSARRCASRCAVGSNPFDEGLTEPGPGGRGDKVPENGACMGRAGAPTL
jgi:GTP-binding protein